MTGTAIVRRVILVAFLASSVPVQAQSWDLARLSRQYRQATVFVQAEIGGQLVGRGTGFVVSRAGYVLTAAHVLDCADCADDGYWATLGQSEGGTRLRARVIRRDKNLDVALLLLDSAQPDLVAVGIGDSDAVNEGDALFVLGFPLREKWVAAPGVLASVDGEGNRWKTTLPLNKGISGGPVFDGHGSVVGIARSGTPDSPLTTVIPIREARNFLRIARLPGTESNAAGVKASSELVVASQLQRSAGEYAGAWKLIGDALAREPDSREARAEQLLIAMEWLRNVRLSSARGETRFSDVVDKLTPVLYRAAATTTGKGRADLLAHLGWANFLKWRDGLREVDHEKQYRDALAVDADNVYANAMLAHWMLYPKGDARTPAQAEIHFARALKTSGSTVDRAFVRQLQIMAWVNQNDWRGPQLARVADDMRRNGEPLDPDTRSRIVANVYGVVRSVEFLEELTALLPPAHHLTTFLWLTEGMDLEHQRTYQLCLARLTEAAGERAKAIELYRSLSAGLKGSRAPVLQEGIERGLARLSGAAR